MRTFKKVKSFGTGVAGATGGKSNEAILLSNTSGSTRTVTVQSIDPDGNLVYVGPFSLVNNQTFIYPIFAYGWTGSGTGVNGWELF
jgi:hypothetical protein